MKYPQFDRGFKFSFFEEPWEGYILTEEELIELNDSKECAALTIYENNAIFISEGSVSKRVVTHEMFHMRVKYFHLDSTEIDRAGFEEMCADWAGYELEAFLKKRNQIFKKFKKLEDSK